MKKGVMFGLFLFAFVLIGSFGLVGSFGFVSGVEENIPTIILVSPNGGEKFHAGDNITITWDSKLVTEVTFTFRSEKIGYVVGAGIAPDNNSSNLTRKTARIKIPNLSSSNDWKLLILQNNNQNIIDSSDSAFTIGDVSVDVSVNTHDSTNDNSEQANSIQPSCSDEEGLSCTSSADCNNNGGVILINHECSGSLVCCTVKANSPTISETSCLSFECSLDNKCYPIGFRKSGRYCSANNDFVSQLEANVQCDNNFECGSNVCVSGQCIETSLIQKILEWFRNLFSGE